LVGLTIANTIQDRLPHHSLVMKITGNLYRTKGKVETILKKYIPKNILTLILMKNYLNSQDEEIKLN
jgi:hypothetical protein